MRCFYSISIVIVLATKEYVNLLENKSFKLKKKQRLKGGGVRNGAT